MKKQVPLSKSNNMKQKIPVALLLNDIHISKDNIPEFQKNWDEALAICSQYHISDMIIGGDLWLSRSAQTLGVLMAVRQAIIKATNAGIYLTIAEGNHDKVDQESILGYGHLFSEYPNVDVVDGYTIIDIGDNVSLYIMSYFPENGSFTQRLQDIVISDFDPCRHNILYIHEGINGALATPNEKELPSSIFKDFSQVLVGHYHNRCVVANTNIEYIGSSRQHNFGEDEEKGYTVLYSDGSYEFVKNQVNTRYKVMEINGSQYNAIIDELPVAKANELYKIKVRIKCDSTMVDTIDKQKLLEVGATKVEIVTEEMEITPITSHALDKKFDKSGIKQEYTAFCADKGITNVEMGLAYLDKIN